MRTKSIIPFAPATTPELIAALARRTVSVPAVALKPARLLHYRKVSQDLWPPSRNAAGRPFPYKGQIATVS